MSIAQRISNQLQDRPEYKSMPEPTTMGPEATVAEAVAAMYNRNYGCVVVVDNDRKVMGMLTERDIMRKLVHEGKDPKQTKVADIMSSKPRVAHPTDNVVDWLRIMSNERFRRLPVVDDKGRLLKLFTQGDFVSYTWPDLLHEFTEGTKKNIRNNYPLWMLVGGIMLYSLAMILLVSAI